MWVPISDLKLSQHASTTAESLFLLLPETGERRNGRGRSYSAVHNPFPFPFPPLLPLALLLRPPWHRANALPQSYSAGGAIAKLDVVCKVGVMAGGREGWGDEMEN